MVVTLVQSLPVQERVNVAGISPWKGLFAMLALGWHLRTWILEVSHFLTVKGGSLCKQHGLQQTLLSSSESGMLVHARQRVPHNPQ